LAPHAPTLRVSAGDWLPCWPGGRAPRDLPTVRRAAARWGDASPARRAPAPVRRAPAGAAAGGRR
jgi:hypothetical protein